MKMSPKIRPGRTHLMRCGVSLVAFMATPVWAAPATNGDSADDGIQEIVVTAQKRQESLNKVGLTVNVLGEAALRDRQISTIQDLTASVSSMTFAETPTSSPIISLRGVGFYDTSLSATPAVSLYLNQVPLAYPIMAGHGIYDLQRVEVLKGPQGILFGQNSTGGAINYVPAAPTNSFSAGIIGTAGNYDQLGAEAFVSGPLSDTVRARISGRVDTASGWQRSMSRPTGPDSRNGRKRVYEGRFLVDFEPVSGVKFEFNANGWIDRGQTQAAQLAGFNVQIPGFGNSNVLASPLAPADSRAADWTAGVPRKDNSFWQLSLRGDIALAGDVSLTSVTAYSRFRQNEGDAFDGTPYAEQIFDPQIGSIKSFFQELRLNNGGAGRLRWIVGGNYQKDHVTQSMFYRWNTESISEALGLGPNGQNMFGVDQRSTSWAGFVNADFDILPNVTAKGGIRYTHTSLSTDNCGYDVTPPYPVGELFWGAGNYKPGACFPVNNLGYAKNGVAPGTPGRYQDSQTEENVSWKVGLDWKPGDGTLIYVNVSKGYKGGGYPAIGASVWSQFQKLRQESVLDYEVGTKLSLLDRHLQINAAAFYYQYNDKQLRARNIDPFWGNLDVVQNIPKSSIRGAEVEVTALPFSGLTLTGSASYTDGKIDEFSGVNAAGVQSNFAGSRMPFSPKWNLGLDGQYSFSLGDGARMFAGGNVNYRSSTIAVVGGDQNPPNATPQNRLLYGIDAYTTVNLRAGIEKGGWRAEVWGKNVFNSYYWSTVYPAYDTIVRYAGMPATYGITVGLKI